ncbi:MAG: CBS domain-containing protein [Thermoplasmata archaeon]|nr:CBS domain-containing protein [Thermoplasmata archaeon]
MPQKSKEVLKAKDLMTTKVITVEKDATLESALGIMKKYNVHVLPVMKKNKPVGVVTYEEFIKRRQWPMTTKMESIMLPAPKVSPDATIEEVAEMMHTTGHRAILVVEGNTLKGIISRRDLVAAVSEVKNYAGVPVSNIMSREPICISESDTLDKARQLIKSLDETNIPVVDKKGKAVGVIGLKDIANALSRDRLKGKMDWLKQTPATAIEVKSIMNPPVTVDPKSNLKEAIQLMEKNKISSVLVTESSKPVGILTAADVVEFVASSVARPTTYVQITGLEEDHDTMDAFDRIVSKGLKRIGRFLTPRMLNVHVSTIHRTGEVKHYTTAARLTTPRGVFYARNSSWDILECIDTCMRELEKRAKKEKDKLVTERKKAGRTV